MKRTVLGGVVATVVVYLWGFLFWGASPLPYVVWKETPDDRAAGQALLQHFPESGVYYLPANGNPDRSELFDAGPVGFVFIDTDGRPAVDPSIMIGGFALNAVIVALVALVLGLSSATTYAARMKLVVVTGVASVVLVNFGNSVWWAIPWSWELVQGFYNFSAWLIAGAIMARFLTPSEGVAS